jgi:hypothetical protein
MSNTVVLILRFLHVFLGVFWAGSGLFLAFFLGPAVKAAGPDGGKVMGQLSASKWPVAIAASALLSTLAGFALYFINWGQASSTPSGIGFSIGGPFRTPESDCGWCCRRPHIGKGCAAGAGDSIGGWRSATRR